MAQREGYFRSAYQQYPGVPQVGMGGSLKGAMLGSMSSGDPFFAQEMQARNAPRAWELAGQMLAPGAGMQPGGGGADFSAVASALSEKLTSGEHPGMSDPEFQQALKMISGEGASQRNRLAGTMSSFSGSLDPEAYMRAGRAIGGQEMRARGSLVAERARRDREALMGGASALAPYFRGQQSQFGELSGLAGRIMSSGVFSTRPSFSGGF